MTSRASIDLLRDGVMDAELMALLWLLGEGGLPVTVIGDAPAADRSALAAACVALPPTRPWVVIDADAEAPTAERLAALLQGGVGFAMTLASPDLKTMLVAPGPLDGLPDDGLRRLGIVLVAHRSSNGLRCRSVHYLRPSERDGQGHIQRRPPAVLAALDEDQDRYEHYAWGITPELADRLDRSQADLEERHHDRRVFLEDLAAESDAELDPMSRTQAFLAAEPERIPAPHHGPAQPATAQHGLTDPHTH